MWLNGKDTLPQLITMMLPNDHGAGIRPEDGYPYPQSFMADNDLALGRTLNFLSRPPYWKNMLVIVTEDDPQGGVDHLDAHRSILMMAGPYVKRNQANFKIVTHELLTNFSECKIAVTLWNKIRENFWGKQGVRVQKKGLSR